MITNKPSDLCKHEEQMLNGGHDDKDNAGLEIRKNFDQLISGTKRKFRISDALNWL